MKQLNHIIKKIKVISFNKSHCSRPVTQLAVGNMWASVTVEMVSGYCVLSYVSDKLCIASIVFYGISTCIICNNDAVRNILYRNMLSSEQQLAYSLLCCIDQTAESNLIQLRIFIHHNHVTEEAAKCHSLPVFLGGRLIFDSMQCVTGTQSNDQPARRLHAPKHVFFASKMFLMRKSITNRPYPVLYTILPVSVCYNKT
jgi:hypothetical protein